ncbi:unnamed protein product [Staurois parvus]|uniref:Uncharacterized protein n=1 Tax=Staurois parvus TaxID=386267 RepID=A0ABN9F0M8_9NEOB|nr:unnamed protein product [Staurois parvus]
MYVHIHTCTCMHTQTRTHTCTYTQTHVQIHTCTYTQTRVQIHTCTYTQTHEHRQNAHTHTHPIKSCSTSLFTHRARYCSLGGGREHSTHSFL